MPNQTSVKPVAYFVRHGTTDANQQARYRGSKEWDLDEAGKLDANRLARYFKNIELGSAYTSPLKRATETAEKVLSPKGMTAQVTSELKPWDTGYIAGEMKSSLKQDIDFFHKNRNEKVPGGESLNDVTRRAWPKFKEIIATGATSGKPSIAFTHSSMIHELNHMIYKNPGKVLVRPGGVVGVYHDPTKALQAGGLQLKALVRGMEGKSVDYGG